MPIAYADLRFIWWLLLGIFLIGFAVLDGFDIGAAILLPFVARHDDERRVVINTVGPVWEGNQVWFILGGGAIFAAWPMVYAVSFSGFYLAMFIVLLTFILRPVCFKYRSKVRSPGWRTTWDYLFMTSGLIASLLFGVVIGNVLQGIPFHFDASLRPFYTGTFLQLLNPFALLCGLVSVTMLTMHGACYLAMKTEAEIQNRTISIARWASVGFIILFAVGGFWIMNGIEGYRLAHAIAHDGPSNPLHKEVVRSLGAWMTNYQNTPWTRIFPGLGFMGALVVLLISRLGRPGIVFIASAVAVFSVIATVGVSLFPFLLPSVSDPNMSLLVWDASSSQLTLTIMLFATLIFMPIILAYTAWVYHVLRGKISVAFIHKHQDSVY